MYLIMCLPFSSFSLVMPTICYDVNDSVTWHFNNAQGNASSTDAAILIENSAEEGEISSSIDGGFSRLNPHKMLDFDLNELPALEDEDWRHFFVIPLVHHACLVIFRLVWLTINWLNFCRI